MNVIQSMLQRLRRRDGSSPKAAIIVGNVREEYAWLARHYPRYKCDMQTLCEYKGKRYDLLSVVSERGEREELYFDVSRTFGKT
jgi:predicted RNA-binding protein associated with RNAse of E/G family